MTAPKTETAVQKRRIRLNYATPEGVQISRPDRPKAHGCGDEDALIADWSGIPLGDPHRVMAFPASYPARAVVV